MFKSCFLYRKALGIISKTLSYIQLNVYHIGVFLLMRAVLMSHCLTKFYCVLSSYIKLLVGRIMLEGYSEYQLTLFSEHSMLSEIL